MLGFQKDGNGPSQAVGALGTLASQTQTQQNPEVRFHLGVLFFWIEDSQDAAGEFRQVQAHVFERCIDSPPACTRIAAGG